MKNFLFAVSLFALVAVLAVMGHGFVDPAALAVTFVPAWVATDSIMSGQSLMTSYTIGANPAYTNGLEPEGLYIQGFDPSLGIGQFIYAKLTNAAGCNAGDVCELSNATYSSGSSVSLINAAQQWAGTANSGKTLCVALATLTQNQYGWFQVYGAAAVNISGAFAAGNGAYWNALGKVQSAAVASKQMVSAQCVVAPSASFGQGTAGTTPTVSANQAILFINAPHAQSAIT